MLASREDSSQLLADARRRLARAVPPAIGWIPAGALRAPAPDVPPESDASAASDVSLRPAAVPRLSWDVVGVPSRAVLGLTLVAVLAVLLGGSYVWRARPQAVEVPALSTIAPASGEGPSAGASLSTPSNGSSSAPSSPGPSGAAGPTELVVHVAGQVRAPGVVRVPLGARVADAVRAAGGAKARADLASVNLARPLVDGEQLVVLRPGAAGAAAGAGGGAAGALGAGSPASGTAASPLDLNAASGEQLESLPGVGPVLAGRILEWRTAHGRFSSVDELREISGIGERTFASLAPAVRV